MESPPVPDSTMLDAPVRPSSARRAPVRLAAAATCALACSGPAGAAAIPSAAVVDRVVTVLDGVQTGSVDGLGYLVISIGAEAVGPAACRGRVLRIDATDDTAPTHLTTMEQVALSAVLSEEVVLVTVPLSPTACRDGRPTFTRLELLPASP